MSLELVNPYVARILLALEDGDAIAAISRKIGASYSYTHEWVTALEDAGVVHRDDGVHREESAFADRIEAAAREAIRLDLTLDDAYLLPNCAGMPYRFAKTDAVYVWTDGGYQIGRNQDDYPIFLDVHREDLGDWRDFFDGFGVATSVDERLDADDGPGIYVVLSPAEELDVAWHDGAAVPPLDEAVAWAQRYPANFEPALEMLDENYDLGLDVRYRERVTG